LIRHADKTFAGNSKYFRELITEFFKLLDFVLNEDGFDFGLLNSDIELPPWTTFATEFFAKHHMAL
jgi:hypothetical protein